MKNVFKLLAMAFVASTMLVACGPDDPATTSEDGTSYKVTVNCNDATMGTVSITPQKDAYEANEEVTIAATPNSGYSFVNWTGAETVAENPYTFKVSANATYTANFKANPQASYNATFDGIALDIAGYSDFQANGEGLWLIQFASRAEGSQVYFPYLVMWMQGDETSNFSVYSDGGAIELYKDTYYTAGENNYGDWQYYATNNMNCSLLDLTTLTLSFTGSFTMYNLGDIVNGTAEEPSGCEQKNLNVTLSNCVFSLPSKGFRKMNVK